MRSEQIVSEDLCCSEWARFSACSTDRNRLLVYLTCVECVVAHHGRQLHIVSHQVHIRMTES